MQCVAMCAVQKCTPSCRVPRRVFNPDQIRFKTHAKKKKKEQIKKEVIEQTDLAMPLRRTQLKRSCMYAHFGSLLLLGAAVSLAINFLGLRDFLESLQPLNETNEATRRNLRGKHC